MPAGRFSAAGGRSEDRRSNAGARQQFADLKNGGKCRGNVSRPSVECRKTGGARSDRGRTRSPGTVRSPEQGRTLMRRSVRTQGGWLSVAALAVCAGCGEV